MSPSKRSPSKGSKSTSSRAGAAGAAGPKAVGGRESEVVDRNIRAITEMEQAAHGASGWPERLGDAVAGFAGTMRFIVLHLVWFAAWIAINVGLVPRLTPFDPYPFTFLTFCVSLEAILLTSMVLISQKRLGRFSEERANVDLQINLLAEQESTKTLRLLRALCEHAGVSLEADDPEAAALSEPTVPSAVVDAVRRQHEPGRPGAD